jgi:hypothetical protein
MSFIFYTIKKLRLLKEILRKNFPLKPIGDVDRVHSSTVTMIYILLVKKQLVYANINLKSIRYEENMWQ